MTKPLRSLVFCAVDDTQWQSVVQITAKVAHHIPPHKAVRAAAKILKHRLEPSQVAKAKHTLVQTCLQHLYSDCCVARKKEGKAFKYRISASGLRQKVTPTELRILKALRTGPQKTSDLKRISLNPANHISCLRKMGLVIKTTRRKGAESIATLVPHYVRGPYGWIKPIRLNL